MTCKPTSSIPARSRTTRIRRTSLRALAVAARLEGVPAQHRDHPAEVPHPRPATDN